MSTTIYARRLATITLRNWKIASRCLKPVSHVIPSCTRLLHSTHRPQASIHSSPPPNIQAALEDLAKNPRAMAVFNAIKDDKELLDDVQALGAMLQTKGYLDPAEPTKQPGKQMFGNFVVLPPCRKRGLLNDPSKRFFAGAFQMMRMLADSDIRNRMMGIAKRLKDIGALDADGKPADVSALMGMLMGGPKSGDGQGKK
ncbi:hypothetical protein BC832DRAFT_305572 [Gaertneriomyces semiglobifer]|nr:hypothetical protein BC832DRAFT_305572 [Gaertneriomyces semiglobifer]